MTQAGSCCHKWTDVSFITLNQRERKREEGMGKSHIGAMIKQQAVEHSDLNADE